MLPQPGRHQPSALEGVKSRMRPFKGVATKYLAGYLAWVRFFDRDDSHEAARTFLLDAFKG
jgi:hypothetical protein